ncbi:MAG: ATP-binding protein [Candidatus Diapherotrites archaeon]
MDAEKFDEQLNESFNLGVDFDESEFHYYLEMIGENGSVGKEQALSLLGCGEFDGKEFSINNTGVMFFAREPQRFVKQNYITCVRYQGNSMVSIVDRKDLKGSLIELANEAEAFVRRHTKLAYKFQDFKRVNIEEYPYNAIREAIINAVCHRDYFLQNNIFVNIFDDKIEVISPGTIPEGLSLNEVYGTSHPRNHRIVELFRKIEYIEKVGSGLKRMEELMLIHGLKKPVFTITHAYFKVTFFGPRNRILDLVKPTGEINLQEIGLNERQIKILNFLQKQGSVLRKQLEDHFGITKKTTTRDLNQLIDKGLVKKEGKAKNVRYELTK